MTRDDPRIDDFAELLMKLVRDEAIDNCERLADGRMKGARAKHWSEVLATASAMNAVTELIPDIVDQVLFYLLDAIDNDRLKLAWRPDNGSWINLADLGHGEMAGWVMSGKGGWIDKFSAKRFFDPLSDLL
jgi:hypothetical protein